MPVASTVSLMIQIQEPETTHQPQELELTEDDVGVLFLQEPELDTNPLLIEHVHLGVPMKPLCSEGCRGLCASCGKNLNTETCECRPSADPRWDALRDFHRNKTKV